VAAVGRMARVPEWVSAGGERVAAIGLPVGTAAGAPDGRGGTLTGQRGPRARRMAGAAATGNMGALTVRGRAEGGVASGSGAATLAAKPQGGVEAVATGARPAGGALIATRRHVRGRRETTTGQRTAEVVIAGTGVTRAGDVRRSVPGRAAPTGRHRNGGAWPAMVHGSSRNRRKGRRRAPGGRRCSGPEPRMSMRARRPRFGCGRRSPRTRRLAPGLGGRGAPSLRQSPKKSLGPRVAFRGRSWRDGWARRSTRTTTIDTRMRCASFGPWYGRCRRRPRFGKCLG
jgi:hypothetical protein